MAAKAASKKEPMEKEHTIDKKKIGLIANNLAHYCSDTMVLYIKTLNFHWTMVGPEFYMYHRLLEEQYRELAEGADALAERIRMMGYSAPGSMATFLELSSLKEAKSNLSQEKMIQELVKDHESMVMQAHPLIDYCDEALDQGSSDLLIDRLRTHDKAAWLLRSHLTRKH